MSLQNVEKAALENPFGAWLKQKREGLGWSVRRLAKESGAACSPSYISQLENNLYIGKKGRPMQADEEIVDALATALGESINEARRLAGHAPVETTDDELVANGFFQDYYDLPEDKRKQARKAIAAVIRSFKDEDFED